MDKKFGKAGDGVRSRHSRNRTCGKRKQTGRIPPDPHWRALLDDRTLLSPAWYDDFLAKYDLDPEHRTKLVAEREAAVAFEKECQLWRPHYERAIEYPASRIFIALREGRLAATGRLLPALDEDEAIDQAEEGKEAGVLDIAATDIPWSFWTLKGIDFELSAAKNAVAHYCHALFPDRGRAESFSRRP